MKKTLLTGLLMINCLIIFGQYTKLLDFSKCPTGKNPRSSFISDGTYLYGATQNGGAYNKGTIFKVMPNGSGFQKIYDFNGTNGAWPIGNLYFDGIYLYGTTQGGGTSDKGVVYKIKPDGSSYLKITDFTGTSNGGSPNGSLISDGTYLYGMTFSGGASNYGVLFKVKTNGTSFSKLIDFNGSSNGGYPTGSVYSDGTYLYGTTQGGGINNTGTLFKIKLTGTGYTKIYDFSPPNGQAPQGTPISDGTYLYGITQSNNGYGDGIVYKIKKDGSSFSVIYNSIGTINGNNLTGSLVSDGTYLYGICEQGGINNDGTIFKLHTDGSNFLKIVDFDNTNYGMNPTTGLYVNGTVLYGMCIQGSINNFGVGFSVNTNGSNYSSLVTFIVLNEGSEPQGALLYDGTYLYGTTKDGGIVDSGIVFRIKPDGTSYQKLFDFTGASTGSFPNCTLISDGTNLYGTTYSGGNYYKGTVFKMKTDGSSFQKILDFNDTNGAVCAYSLYYDNIYLYGATGAGGINGLGVVFKIKPDGTNYTKLHDFGGAGDGSSPMYGSLISDGLYLYGYTSYSGANNFGTLYKIKPDGTGYTTIFNFGDLGSGIYPYGNLAFDGTVLYGTTWQGGANSQGTIFSIYPDGSNITNLVDFSASNGSYPLNGLMFDGSLLYGMTGSGGQYNNGVLYSVMTNGSNYIKLHDFNSIDGSSPQSGVIKASNFLYGLTQSGGAGSLGTIFKYNLSCKDTLVSVSANICQGNTFSIGVHTYSISGVYQDTLHTFLGCDSIITTNLTVNALPNVGINSSNTVVCFGNVVTLSGIGATSYTWSTGVTNGQVFTPANTASYTVTGFDGNNCSNTASVTIVVNQLPNVLANASANTVCENTTVTLFGSGALTYSWTNTIIDNQPFVPVATAIYTVTGTDINGCKNTDTAIVTVLSPPTPSICIVTADSITNFNYNIVYWDKTQYSQIDSFVVYRETTTNNYVRIGAVSKDSSSLKDTARSIGIGGVNGGDPNLSSFKYKLSIIDSCHNESSKSLYHQTMFFQENAANLSWSPYTVESPGTSPVSGYTVFKDTIGTGAWYVFGGTTGNSYTDNSYSSYPNGNWRVNADGFTCNTTQRLASGGNNTIYSTRVKSHSNTARQAGSGINMVKGGNYQIRVYPNPANNKIIVDAKDITEIKLFNILGKEISSTKEPQIDVRNFDDGVYFIQVIANQNSCTQKIIIQH